MRRPRTSWASSSTPAATLSYSSGSPGDDLGSSVALSPDGLTALIGAPGINIFPGAAYVFHVSAESAWTGPMSTPSATLTNSSGSTGDDLGTSVALSSNGTTALVGANGVSGGGAAYVFHVPAVASWTGPISTPAATLANSSASSGQFGDSVALSSDGTTALIGAPLVKLDEGAAFVYEASSQSSWTSATTPTAALTNSAASPDDELGSSVALSSDGTTALIGATGVNGGNTGNGGTGAAYVFQASAEDAWATPHPDRDGDQRPRELR